MSAAAVGRRDVVDRRELGDFVVWLLEGGAFGLGAAGVSEVGEVIARTAKYADWLDVFRRGGSVQDLR